jgi:hypothetical protein
MSHKETYKGYEIVIEDDENTTAEGEPIVSMAAGVDTPLIGLKIDNRRIDVTEVAPGKFLTSYLPYTTYDSIVALAKTVIDDTAEFDTLSR